MASEVGNHGVLSAAKDLHCAVGFWPEQPGTCWGRTVDDSIYKIVKKEDDGMSGLRLLLRFHREVS